MKTRNEDETLKKTCCCGNSKKCATKNCGSNSQTNTDNSELKTKIRKKFGLNEGAQVLME